MASYIAIFLCLVCITLFTILLIRFKKLFSTDSIIEKTRNQMNKMIADINSNANRDMELINESSRRLRALLSEADQKMEQFKLATERLREMIAIAQKVESESGYTPPILENQKAANIKPVGQKAKEIAVNKYTQQNFLFDEESKPEVNSIIKDEINVTPDGAAYKEIPLIVTKVFDEKPIINKTEKNGKQLNEAITKMFNEGYSEEEIAKKLSCSILEVQFIIDMLQKR